LLPDQQIDFPASVLASRRRTWAVDLAAQGFAAELTDAFEVIPVVTGGELISRPVFTRLVLQQPFNRALIHVNQLGANRRR